MKNCLKKIVFLAMGVSVYASGAMAQEGDFTPSLKANVRRLAIEMASTEVKNAEYYQDSPNAKFSADSKTSLKGVVDFFYQYEEEYSQWNNGTFIEYGRTKLKSYDGSTKSSTDDDKILFYSDYNRKMWKFMPDSADIGPFGSLGFETQFDKNYGNSRQKLLRAKGGLKLFNGDILKEIYATPIVEYDFTHFSESILRYGYEAGWRTEYVKSDDVKFQLDGYFRDYLGFSRYFGEDLEYELNVTARMDVKIHNKFSLAPYISYTQGLARNTHRTGSNMMLGLSFAYSEIFELEEFTLGF